jgi:hypothetical protein
MNELTGAFLIARGKGEDLLVTRRSLANAGYSLQEIEEAFAESTQILNKPVAQAPTPEKKQKSKLVWWILSGVFICFIFALIILIALFWEQLSSFIQGSGG